MCLSVSNSRVIIENGHNVPRRSSCIKVALHSDHDRQSCMCNAVRGDQSLRRPHHSASERHLPAARCGPLWPGGRPVIEAQWSEGFLAVRGGSCPGTPPTHPPGCRDSWPSGGANLSPLVPPAPIPGAATSHRRRPAKIPTNPKRMITGG